MNYYDYIVIGSGIAGLYSALLAIENGSVLIVTKGGIEDCNTRYAQGGIAAAIGCTSRTPSLRGTGFATRRRCVYWSTRRPTAYPT
jgi:aspartate oxidase